MKTMMKALVAIAVMLTVFHDVAARGSADIDLPIIGERGTGALDSRLRGSTYAFLVFWKSDCPLCVESLRGCQEFIDEYSDPEISVTGVNCDDFSPEDISRSLDESGIEFEQLHDRSGEATAFHNVEKGLFTILLFENGREISRAEDPHGDIAGLMADMYMKGSEAGPFSREVFSGRVSIRGEARIKYLSTDKEGEGATGPYGEDIYEGDQLLHRFELTVSGKVTDRITVGGLLRISNEGLDVLRGGPDYFDSEYGSAFAELNYGGVAARLGYYSISMTPLTLMRWDWQDNPRTGGNAGCGCGAVAGTISSKSLELLGPDLRMEGAMLSYGRGEWNARMFYAMPRRARSINANHTSFGGEEMAVYSLETAGFETVWKRYVERSDSYLEAGLHGVAVWEDPRSIDPGSLGYSRDFEWIENAVLSLTARLPVYGGLAMRGEWAVYNSTTAHDSGVDGDERSESDGDGGYAGISFDHAGKVGVEVDYLRISSGFFSPLSALSYKAGMQGVRASSLVRYPDERFALSLFYKSLDEIEPYDPAAESLVSTTIGLSLDTELRSGLGAGLAFIGESDSREGAIEPVEIDRRVYSLTGRYRFTPRSYVEALYQRVDNIDDRNGTESEVYMASLFFVGSF